ncbi:MAG: hypothetical protein AB8G11_06730 [Saprospiraceae bacterium]
MPYLSPKTIAQAWENCIESGVSNAFMGLLQVMRLIDDNEIQPSKQYKINSGELSNNLESLFTFYGQKAYIINDSYYHIIFPENWKEAVKKTFLKILF